MLLQALRPLGCCLAQIYENSEAGQKYKAFYRLTDLPVTMVIDPVTGAALRTWHGALEPQRCVCTCTVVC